MTWPGASVEDATNWVFNAFMDSSGHRDNIMGKAWDVVAVGAYKGSGDTFMWTVLFADKCSSSTPTATPKPKPPATAKPKPKPAATPRPTPKPTPGPPASHATPTPTVAPEPSAAWTPFGSSRARPDATPTAELRRARRGRGDGALRPDCSGSSPTGADLGLVDSIVTTHRAFFAMAVHRTRRRFLRRRSIAPGPSGRGPHRTPPLG